MATETKVALIQPLPWRVVDGRVVDINGFTVMHNVTLDEAEFIVRAVNCHDDLLAAVRRARDIELSVTQGQERELRVGYLAQLESAIRKAEGD